MPQQPEHFSASKDGTRQAQRGAESGVGPRSDDSLHDGRTDANGKRQGRGGGRGSHWYHDKRNSATDRQGYTNGNGFGRDDQYRANFNFRNDRHHTPANRIVNHALSEIRDGPRNSNHSLANDNGARRTPPPSQQTAEGGVRMNGSHRSVLDTEAGKPRGQAGVSTQVNEGASFSDPQQSASADVNSSASDQNRAQSPAADSPRRRKGRSRKGARTGSEDNELSNQCNTEDEPRNPSHAKQPKENRSHSASLSNGLGHRENGSVASSRSSQECIPKHSSGGGPTHSAQTAEGATPNKNAVSDDRQQRADTFGAQPLPQRQQARQVGQRAPTELATTANDRDRDGAAPFSNHPFDGREQQLHCEGRWADECEDAGVGDLCFDTHSARSGLSLATNSRHSQGHKQQAQQEPSPGQARGHQSQARQSAGQSQAIATQSAASPSQPVKATPPERESLLRTVLEFEEQPQHGARAHQPQRPDVESGYQVEQVPANPAHSRHTDATLHAHPLPSPLSNPKPVTPATNASCVRTGPSQTEAPGLWPSSLHPPQRSGQPVPVPTSSPMAACAPVLEQLQAHAPAFAVPTHFQSVPGPTQGQQTAHAASSAQGHVYVQNQTHGYHNTRHHGRYHSRGAATALDSQVYRPKAPTPPSAPAPVLEGMLAEQSAASEEMTEDAAPYIHAPAAPVEVTHVLNLNGDGSCVGAGSGADVSRGSSSASTPSPAGELAVHMHEGSGSGTNSGNTLPFPLSHLLDPAVSAIHMHAPGAPELPLLPPPTYVHDHFHHSAPVSPAVQALPGPPQFLPPAAPMHMFMPPTAFMQQPELMVSHHPHAAFRPPANVLMSVEPFERHCHQLMLKVELQAETIGSLRAAKELAEAQVHKLTAQLNEERAKRAEFEKRQSKKGRGTDVERGNAAAHSQANPTIVDTS